jgi:hypothetical protein
MRKSCSQQQNLGRLSRTSPNHLCFPFLETDICF